MDATALVDRLDQLLPGFRRYLGGQRLFDAGSPHEVFACCSHFVRDESPAFAGWERLAGFLNEVVDGSGSRLEDAACSCFLESLVAPHHPLSSSLRGKAKEWWTRCEATSGRSRSARVRRRIWIAFWVVWVALLAAFNVAMALGPGARETNGYNQLMWLFGNIVLSVGLILSGVTLSAALEFASRRRSAAKAQEAERSLAG
jgi:hypothetical protein